MSLRRRYLFAHVFEAVLGLLATFSATTFFLDPTALTRSAVGQAIHPFDHAWNALYLLSGIFILVGLVLPKPRIELAGLCFLATAVSINAIAYAYVRPTPFWIIGLFTYLSVALACAVRGYDLVSRAEALVLRLEPEETP